MPSFSISVIVILVSKSGKTSLSRQHFHQKDAIKIKETFDEDDDVTKWPTFIRNFPSLENKSNRYAFVKMKIS